MRCMDCNGPVEEAWDRLDHNDRENLKRILGIRPLCCPCLLKRYFKWAKKWTNP